MTTTMQSQTILQNGVFTDSPPATPISTTTSPPKPSITVTRVQAGRSFQTAAIHALARPLRKKLNKVKEQPGGSNPLDAPIAAHEHCTIHERLINDIYVYDINVRSSSTNQFVAYTESFRGPPKNMKVVRTQASKASLGSLNRPPTRSPTRSSPPSSPSRPGTNGQSAGGVDQDHFHPLTRGSTDPEVRTKDWALHHDGERRKRPRQIYYFAGGSWQMPPTSYHWKLCAHIARELTARGTQTTVSIVSVPLAPRSPASVAWPMLEDLYYGLFPRTGADAPPPELLPPVPDPEVIFAGDSSGANIALGLTLHMLANDPLAPAPASLMLLSPTVDMRTDNPEMIALDKKDPVLSLKTTKAAHAAWCGTDVSYTDPRVSPILGDLSLLQQRSVQVHGVNGGHDILAPDIRKFIDKLQYEGVEGRWLDWDRQMHVFPLTFVHNIEEGKKGVEFIINTLESAPRKRSSHATVDLLPRLRSSVV